jgi:hypothetical protein
MVMQEGLKLDPSLLRSYEATIDLVEDDEKAGFVRALLESIIKDLSPNKK